MAEDSGASGSRSAGDSLVGRTVAGKYRIESKLGGGGMGTVYLATQAEIGRTVAVKIIHRHLTEDGDTEFLNRFKREVKAASLIEHPHAVPVYDFGIEEDAPYLVMRYIEGRSLKVALDEGKQFTLEQVVAITQGLPRARDIALAEPGLRLRHQCDAAVDAAFQ